MSALQIIDDMKKIDRKAPMSEIKAQAEAMKNILQANLRAFLVGPGAVSEAEYKLMDKVIANPSEIFQVNNQARLDVLKKAILRKSQIEAKIAGLNVVDTMPGDVTTAKPVEGIIGKGKK